MVLATVRSRWRPLRRSVQVMALGLVSCFGACNYNEDDRCSEGMELVDRSCLCPEGSTLTETGSCLSCGDNEVIAGSQCVCDEGYARASEGICEQVDGAGGEGGSPGTEPDPPSGLGDPCSSDDECTGDAGYCDTFMSQTCLVAGCSLDPDDCYMGYECCDLSMFGLGTLCVPEGGCM